MDSEPPAPRRDLTPCLLFPELMERGGGLARAVCERASLYARHYERVIIFTTGFSPRIDAVVALLKERGSLDERVVVRNFFQHSSWVARLSEPPRAALSVFASAHVDSRRQRMPGGQFFRIADRHQTDRHPWGYRYFDSEGLPLLTTRTGPGSKHEQLATFHSAQTEDVDWGTIVAEWVDEELAGLPSPVLFSLQRGYNDPVLLASRKAVRKVASLHNCHYFDPEDPWSGTRISFRPLLHHPRAVDEIVCLTTQQRRELEIEVPGMRIRSVPYPGRPPREEPGAKDLQLVVLVAQLTERKRVDHAIRAFALVVQSLSHARLEVYGEGPAEGGLRRLIEELGLQESVFLMGYSLMVNRAQARAACTLMTSTFEGFARIISESMSLGTPVVAYDVRYGPRDLIRPGVDGLLVEVHEPEALAEAVVRMLRDPQRALEMGVRARDVIERFPIADFERSWLDVVSATNQPERARPRSVQDLTTLVMRRSDRARRLRKRMLDSVRPVPGLLRRGAGGAPRRGPRRHR